MSSHYREWEGWEGERTGNRGRGTVEDGGSKEEWLCSIYRIFITALYVDCLVLGRKCKQLTWSQRDDAEALPLVHHGTAYKLLLFPPPSVGLQAWVLG